MKDPALVDDGITDVEKSIIDVFKAEDARFPTNEEDLMVFIFLLDEAEVFGISTKKEFLLRWLLTIFLILVNMEFRYVFLGNYYSLENNECMLSIKNGLRS